MGPAQKVGWKSPARCLSCLRRALLGGCSNPWANVGLAVQDKLIYGMALLPRYLSSWWGYSGLAAMAYP